VCFVARERGEGKGRGTSGGGRVSSVECRGSGVEWGWNAKSKRCVIGNR